MIQMAFCLTVFAWIFILMDSNDIWMHITHLSFIKKGENSTKSNPSSNISNYKLKLLSYFCISKRYIFKFYINKNFLKGGFLNFTLK